MIDFFPLTWQTFGLLCPFTVKHDLFYLFKFKHGSFHSFLPWTFFLLPLPLLTPSWQTHINTRWHTHTLTERETQRARERERRSTRNVWQDSNCTEILCSPYKAAAASHVTHHLHAAWRKFTLGTQNTSTHTRTSMLPSLGLTQQERKQHNTFFLTFAVPNKPCRITPNMSTVESDGGNESWVGDLLIHSTASWNTHTRNTHTHSLKHA